MWLMKLRKKKGGAEEIDVGDVGCNGEHRERMKKWIYVMRNVVRMYGSQQENSMAKRFIRISYNEESESSRSRELIGSFEDCEKIISRETENRVEKNEFTEDEARVKWGR